MDATEDLPSIGTKVRVKPGSYYPHLIGEIGTVSQYYGDAARRVINVRFADEEPRLFWPHQVEEITEQKADRQPDCQGEFGPGSSSF